MYQNEKQMQWHREQQAYDAELRAQVEAMPRIRFVCERTCMYRDRPFVIGFMWSRNIDAQPGERIYGRQFCLRLHFRLVVER